MQSPAGRISNVQVRALLPEKGFIARYCEWAVQMTEAPLVFHLGSALSMLATASDHALRTEGGSPLRSNLWVLLKGPSQTAHKSYSIELAENLLKDVGLGIAPEPGSPEGLFEALGDKPRALLTYPEFGNFLQQARDDSSPHSRVKSTFVKLWTMESYEAKWRGRKISLDGIKLSMLAGVNESYLENESHPTDWHAGFFGRFLWLGGDREDENRKDEAVDCPTEIQRSLRARLVAGLHRYSEECLSQRQRHRYRGVTPEGRAVLRKFNTELEHVQDLPGHLEPLIQNASTQAKKVAMLYAFDRGPYRTGAPWCLDQEAMTFGCGVARLSVQTVLGMSEEIALTLEQRERRAVLRAVGTANGVAPDFGDVIRLSKLPSWKVKRWLISLKIERAIEVLRVSGTERYYPVGKPPSGD